MSDILNSEPEDPLPFEGSRLERENAETLSEEGLLQLGGVAVNRVEQVEEAQRGGWESRASMPLPVQKVLAELGRSARRAASRGAQTA
jgi:hypothetical protein